MRTQNNTSKKPPRVLFICGSMNQTTQMHKIAEELCRIVPEAECAFTPYYTTSVSELFRRWGWMEFTILGNRIAKRALQYCSAKELAIDFHGMRGPYDLVATCADLIIPRNIRHARIILVQEGMTDPEGVAYKIAQKFRFLPRWMASTSMMGLSGSYTKFCVASEAYKKLFIRKGAPANKIIVTGIPNFDDCAEHLNNNFPHRNYFLVCTSDLRETFMSENRKKFILRAIELAAGRQILFKLHPNENFERAMREIEQYAPGSLVYTEGNTDDMIANCSAFLTHYSSTVYVALALGKEVYCDLDLEGLKRLLPVQNRSAAKNIAMVCKEVLETVAEQEQPKVITYSFARRPFEWVRTYYRGLRAVSE